MSVSELEKLRITKNPGKPDERQYDIYPIQEVTLTSRKEAVSIAPPGLAAKDNILLGINGMQADIEVRATVWDDGSDRANGTHSSTVTTVGEQITYLEDDIHAPDFGVTWQLDHLTGAAFNSDDVFVEEVAPTVINQESPKWKSVRLRLRRGSSA